MLNLMTKVSAIPNRANRKRRVPLPHFLPFLSFNPLPWHTSQRSLCEEIVGQSQIVFNGLKRDFRPMPILEVFHRPLHHRRDAVDRLHLVSRENPMQLPAVVGVLLFQRQAVLLVNPRDFLPITAAFLVRGGAFDNGAISAIPLIFPNNV